MKANRADMPLRWAWLLGVLLLLMLLSSVAHGAAPSFSVAPVTCPEGGPCAVTITKSAKASSYSKLHVFTNDGTALASVDYGAVNKSITVANSVLKVTVPVTILARPGYQGTRAFTFAIIPTRNGTTGSSMATVTIADTSPAPPPPTPQPTSWVLAPLQDGSFARVKANDNDWNMTGPGAGRPLVPGEIVAVYFNGWGYDADGSASFAILALSDRTSGRARAADLEGVAPVGTPPTLPVDWWVPGLVKANKTCTDPRQGHEGQPGVTQGGVYRAAMVAGSHMKLAPGVTGVSSSMWQIFGSGDQNSPATMAATVVNGDCITGFAALATGSLVTRLGLVYRVVIPAWPDPLVRPAGPVIYGVQYVSDTTGHYYLANDPGLKQEVQYFYDADLTPAS